MTLALYRKYRPRTFAEVIGQEHVTEPLSQALRTGRLHHAYLFSGPRGCGKTSSARILARSLNCESGPTPDPCGQCGSCRSLMGDGSGSIDVIEIDAASHGGVDDARELREKAFFAPASSRYKIYVIDEAHMVSSAGFNALLKLVEEPPDYVKFIFATTEPDKVLGTIRSRTHHYPFRLIPPAVLRPYLEQLCAAEEVRVDPAVFPLVVRAGGGSARDALSVLDQLIAGAGPDGVGYARAVALLGVTDVALIDEMCDALAAGDGAAAYVTIDRVAEAGHDPRRFATDLLERLRDLIVIQQVPDAVAKGIIDGPADQIERMVGQASRLGPAMLSRCADIVHNGLVEMRGTTAPRLLLELITARMLLPGAEDSAGALLQRMERLERRLTLTGSDHDHGVRAAPAPAVPQPPAVRAEPAGPAGRAEPAEPGPADRAGPAEQASTARRAEAPSAPGSAPAAAEPRRPAPAGPGPRGVERAGPDATAPAAAPTTAPPASDSPESPLDEAGRDAYPTQAAPTVPAQQTAPRPSPDRVLPDPVAPDEPPPAAPGRLSAAAVRETWPEIVTMVGRKSKKIAALAQGATVRDLDGDTVVLTFRFPAHARMLSSQPELVLEALYEVLGGRWQIRCEVAGDAGAPPAASRPAPPRPAQPSQRPGQPGPRPAQPNPRPGQPARPASQPAGRPATPAEPAGGDTDWPEPARPGGGTERPPATAAEAGRSGQAAASWSDGTPAEEPPYDPEYDGPPRPGGPTARGYEGFDPGDEPLDDVVDEKTARQSSEQQAMRLLQDAFGAEKIGEG